MFAYADPPYYGMGKRLYGRFHAEASDWDDLITHQALVDCLSSEFPDGWVLSLSSPSLRHILPMCPDDARVGAWVKPWAAFRPNVNPAYAWEPVIFRGGRKRTRQDLTVRDWVSEGITMMRGLPGAKPDRFCRWVIDLMGATDEDEWVDVFPGTDTFGHVLAQGTLV